MIEVYIWVGEVDFARQGRHLAGMSNKIGPRPDVYMLSDCHDLRRRTSSCLPCYQTAGRETDSASPLIGQDNVLQNSGDE